MKVVRKGPAGPGRRSNLRALFLPCLLAAVAGGFLAWLALGAKASINDWAFENGHHKFDKQANFYSALLAVPGRMLRSVDAPELALEIKPRNLNLLYQKREQALAKGLLETEEGDLVPGQLTVNGVASKIKLRLKGDYTDHLMGKKWSFRIHVSGADQVLGMRRFSIQNPNTKGFFGEAVYFACLRHVGVVAPRYQFVRVSINGDDLGVMAVEEHFSKELLENNGRRESVIINFDETLMFHGLDDYRTAPVTTFREGRVAASEALQRDQTSAVGLMRGFVEGTLRPSEVFDVEELAGFLAAAELWGTWHPIRWHNMRFYLDPVGMRLAPVGFDANLQQRRPLGTVVLLEEPIIRRFLDDPVVFSAYERKLRQLCRDVAKGDLVQQLVKIESEALQLLQTEFLLLEGFPYASLVARAEFHLGLTSEELRSPAPLESAPLLLRAYLVDDADGKVLELINTVERQVEVRSIRWVSAAGAPAALFRSRQPLQLPLTMEPMPTAGPPQTVRIPCEAPPGAASTIELEVGVPDREGGESVLAVATHPRLERRPVPDSSVDEQLKTHSFLQLDGDGSTLRVQPGTWRVSGNLVVPAGHSLAASAGTELRFDADAALVAHGPLRLQGTASSPVVLAAAEDGGPTSGWLGVVVIDAGSPSSWQHVRVENTTGISFSLWQLTGGVAFYKSDVTLVDTRLEGTRAEDALNIVHSKFTLERLTVTGTTSDAFDADFADGRVVGCEFTNVGGDAVDISGSDIEVEGCRFSDVRDKALSVGERSKMRAKSIVVESSGTGAACKDGSLLELTDSSIDGPSFAGMAVYIKKPEDGPARIQADRVTYSGTAPRTRVQTGSSIVIDGELAASEDIDVDALYETVMRKNR